MFSNSIIVNLCSLFLIAHSFVGYGQRNLTDYQVLNLQRDTLSLILDTSKTQIIVLANRNTCKDCYRPLNSPSDLLNQKLSTREIQITFLCRVENNIPARKSIWTDLRLWMPALVTNQNVFFDIYTDNYVYYKVAQSGVFGDFKVNKTPAILLYRPNQETLLFDYDVLYDYLKQAKSFSVEDMVKFRTTWTSEGK